LAFEPNADISRRTASRDLILFAVIRTILVEIEEAN
jgi:hypothetical protein